MIRSTTNGTLKTYRYNLQRSSYTMNKARETVQTQRQFNSFAEDPAAAAKAFQLRRSLQRTDSQYNVGDSVKHKYEVAWNTLESVTQDVNNRASDSAFAMILQGKSDTIGSGAVALGQSMRTLATGIVQSMNCRYGENFVFAGADGLNVPFEWQGEGDDRKLCYRGIPVDTKEPPVIELNPADQKTPLIYDKDGTVNPNAKPPYYKTKDGVIPAADYDKQKKEWDALEYMAKGERKNADLGFGMQEDEKGNVISSSVANVGLQGITFLGYGKDADGDPKNIVSIADRLGTLLRRCDSNSGDWASAADKEEFSRLAKKFEAAASELTDKHTEMDTQAAFIKSNQDQLKANTDTLQEQILGIEEVDLADAITSFSWAQYCYNMSIKVGNSILSQSLMDYINT